MSGIFLSYRRVDTEPWAGRLFNELKMRFPFLVFMDIKGGIPRGANFEQELTRALAGCEVLLALIGPKWLTCTQSDGTRRLDGPDDWVRKEIASVLQRAIPVVPVLLGGARRPETELPDDLHKLLKQQAAEIREESFDHDFEELVKDVERQTSLRRVRVDGLINDFWREMSEIPPVRDQMATSVDAAAAARKHAEELERHKVVHDLLHHIEFDIQRPIQAMGPNGAPLRQFRHQFIDFRRTILEQIQGQELSHCTSFNVALQSTEDAFNNARDAGDKLTQDAYGKLLYELNSLIEFTSYLDGAISAIEKHLESDDVARKLEECILPARSSQEPRFESIVAEFTRNVQALKDIQQELEQRVLEHRKFQALDWRLRVICKGRALDLANQWQIVKQLRSQLPQPRPQAWQDISADIESTESAIEAALLTDEGTTRDLLN